MSRFSPRRNKTHSFEKMVLSDSKRTRPEGEIEGFFTTGRQKIIESFRFVGFCSHCNTVFETKGCFYHFCQELRPSLADGDTKRGSKKGELDALRRHYTQEKGCKFNEMWEGEWWRLYKTTNTFKQHIQEHFPYRRSLTAKQLLEEIKEEKLFGYVQCDNEVPKLLRANFANFSQIIKNNLVSKSDIGE